MFQTNRSCYDLTHKYLGYCNRMFSLSVCRSLHTQRWQLPIRTESQANFIMCSQNWNCELQYKFHKVFKSLACADLISLGLCCEQYKSSNSTSSNQKCSRNWLSYLSSVDVLDCLLNFLPHPLKLPLHKLYLHIPACTHSHQIRSCIVKDDD